MKITVVSFIAAVFLLSACGIKPVEVDPPQGRANDTFPHTYPAPESQP